MVRHTADLVQDCSDLKALADTAPAPLQALGVDLAMFTDLANKGRELASIYAVSKGDKTVAAEAKRMRDAAHTLLDEAIGEIRAVGQYVFWREPDRAKLYASAYLRTVRRRSRNADDTASGTPAA